MTDEKGLDTMPVGDTAIDDFKKITKRLPSSEAMFGRDDVDNLCSVLRSRNSKKIVPRMDTLVKKAGITKKQWNDKYSFKVLCNGRPPIVYALKWQYKNFEEVADYGVDLNRMIRDLNGNLSTLVDYVTYRYRDKNTKGSKRTKFKKILKYLRKHKAKGCKDQPELKCTATYF